MGGFDLTGRRHHVLDEVFDLICFFAAFADGIAFGELDAALFWDYGCNGCAVFFQNACDPVADANHGLHFAVFQPVERAAVIKEPADLLAKAHRGLLHGVPFGVV
ncbi:hypothetical protein ASD8599_04020 [Ascidiaceihabitans donghaensis]|uniref:Uncharacterized protein n=1 Tax=Ascidiaceihabitans donghaensis TaxID=1510460 RepID=A0A2R8BPM0_9RHOB|nr:hypothetical protein ASD8599_04020 [Ascidiaceihabitans donghaensis]